MSEHPTPPDRPAYVAPQGVKLEELARAIFAAYNAEGPNPWKTFDGRPVPHWEGLSDQVRGKWCAAALCALELL